MAPLEPVLAPLKIMASTVAGTEAGSDVEDIQGAGVPVLALNQDASRYFDYHHTADDTLQIVDPVQLKQNVAAWAATLSILADSTRLSGARSDPPADPRAAVSRRRACAAQCAIASTRGR